MKLKINIRIADTITWLCGLVIYFTTCITVNAQNVYNNGATITINGGSNIYVKGSYIHSSGQVDNTGELHITDSLVNNSLTFGVFGDASNHPASGKVVFNGSGSQQISGSGMTVFLYDFNLDNSSSTDVRLFKTINIENELLLSTGNINLNGRVIELDDNGALNGEANNKRIFGSSGYVRAYRNLVGFTGEIAGLGLHLNAPGNNFGPTEIRRGHYQLSPFSSNGHINRFFEFLPTNPDTDPVNSVAIDFFMDEKLPAHNVADYKIFHSSTGGSSWVKELSVANDQPELDFQAMATDVKYFGGSSTALRRSLITLSEGTCLNPPIVDLGPTSQNLCDETSLELSVIAGQQTYTWKKDGTVIPTATNHTLTVTEGGLYEVEVIDANGCEGTDNITIILKQKPVADFVVTNFACHGNASNFSDQSSSVDGTITYAWEFGDPDVTSDISTESSPSYTYVDPGTFNASLVVTSSFGCVSETTSKPVIVHALPVADFIADQACYGKHTSFTNNSTAGTNSYWDFGNGNISTTSSPQHLFTSSGTHQVTLLVTDPNTTCYKSITQDVIVNAKPVADFEATPGCESNEINFNNSSFISSGTLRYIWDIGKEEKYRQEEFTHRYETPGVYDIKLQVFSELNCLSTLTKTIEVKMPMPVFYGDVVTCGDQLTLDANEDGRFTGGSFTWSDNSTEEKLTVTESGNYSVTIQMPDGCVTEGSVNVTLNSIIAPDLGNNAEACGSYTIDAGFYPSGTYNWSTGSTSRTLTVNESGSYSVSVVDQNGCTGTGSVNVLINSNPVIELGADQEVCNGKTTTLDAGPDQTNYRWSNGSNERFIEVKTSGKYEVEVTNLSGCSASDEINVTVLDPFNIDLGADRTVCAGLTVRLDAGVDNLSYDWRSSNGKTGSAKTLEVNEGGSYWVLASDAKGCVASDTVQVTATDNTLNALFLSSSEVSPGDTVQFINVSYPAPFESAWNFGNGQTSTQEDAQMIYYTEGSYDVSLTVTNGICTAVKTKRLTVQKTDGRSNNGSSGPKDDILYLNAFPNPTSGKVQLEVQLSSEMSVGITVVNLVGNSFFRQIVEAEFIDEVINLTDLTPGVYFIKIVTRKQSRSIRIIKQ